MEKEELIKLLSDNSKTDKEISKIVNLSFKYIRVLRRRWKIKPKKRGMKPGTIISSYNKKCKVCLKSFKTVPSLDSIYCSRKCMHSCEEYLNKLKNMDKSYMQTEVYRNSLKRESTPEYKRFVNRVHRLSSKTYEKYKNIINPNNFPRTKCGIEGGYQLDHIISIRFGFHNNMSPEELSLVENLQILPWKDNLKKGQ